MDAAADAEALDESAELSLPLGITADAIAVQRLQVNELQLGQIQAALDLSNSDLKAAASFIYEELPVELSTTGPWSDLRLDLQALGANLNAAVDLLDEQLPWSARVSSERLDLTPFTDRSLELRALQLEGAGDLSSYRFDVTGQLQDELARAAFSLAGEGDLDGLRFDRFDITYLEPADLPVQVDALQSRGALNWTPGLRFELNELSLLGNALDLPLSASAEQLVLTDTELEITAGAVFIDDRAAARLGGRIAFEGELDLRLATERFPLALADDRLGGLADLQGTVGGTLTAPFINGTAEVAALAWQSEAVGDIRASLDGSLQQGALQLDLTSPEVNGEIALEYEQTDSDYVIGVQMAEGQYAPLAVRAVLREPASVRVGQDRIAFEQICLSLTSDQLDAEPGYLCADLDYPDGRLQLALEPWQVPRLPLPDSDVTANGKVEMAVELTGFAPFVGSARVSFVDLVAHHPDLDPLRLGNLDASIAITEDRLQAMLSTPLDQPQELLMNGALESLLAADPFESPISGSIYMELDGIWVAQSLLPMEVTYELENVRGRVAVNAVIAGRVDDPLIDGSLKLTDAGWQVLAVNTEVADLQALATLKGSERIDFRADSSVGAGSLALQGGILGIGSEAPRLSTSVTFEGAEVLNLPDYQAAVDGELSLEMGTDDLVLKGNMHLPRAEVLIADLPETAVTVSADEVIVDDVQAANVQQLRTTDLTLTLGDEVYLEAFGLSGRLTGNLRVTEAPGRLRSVTGVIRLIDARFEAYGQELAVERGQLTFTGPIDDPNVEVVATRIVNYDDRDYRISLLITGSANDLQTEIRSQPSLSEDDALALLITGRTFSQMTNSERTNVSGAALSMGLLNATGVTQNLADRLNLEEIIVDQDAEGNMEVGAALRLNRNLYLRYTYGVFSRLGGVLLRYRLNNRISVQAKTGDAHSIEIRYGVDQ